MYARGYSMLKGEVEGQLDEKEILMKPIEPGRLLETATKRLARAQ